MNLDRRTFLAKYWQRKPLLIRNAIDDFVTPINANEVAGLAMEKALESRLIEYQNGDWLIFHGPFSSDTFQRKAPWALLVQAVDHYIPKVAALHNLVDFIPQWRIDDIMVSYAVDGGSAGPHYDNYDVFLLQGEGEKIWQLGQACSSASPLLPHEELRILDRFQVEQEVLVRPGDILYVPPGIAHWGTAKGDSLTFSIGFRAPRIRDMASRWFDNVLENIDPQQFLRDPGRDPVARPGEITCADVERARMQLQCILDNGTCNTWLGELVTEPRYLPNSTAQDDAGRLCNPPENLALSAASKLAWQEDTDANVQVFANGEHRSFDASVIKWLVGLCGSRQRSGDALEVMFHDENGRKLLCYLLECGAAHVE
ncbi:MAG: cupin domain-containing protein [Halioglobus sp.]|nr:cupin domain-containing protein [Halioglobus sp.]